MSKTKLLNLLKDIKTLCFNNKTTALVIFSIFCLSLLNSQHAKYPDEFDNILGGYLITQGKLPYVSYFTHHGPVAYFYAAFIALFSGPSFVNFRIILATANFLLASLFIYYIYRRFGQKYFRFVLAIWAVLAISATYWWAHMLLADSLAAFLFLGIFIHLFFNYFDKGKINYRDLWFYSILLSLILLTSLTYIYVVVLLYLSIAYWLIVNKKESKITLLKIAGIFLLPYLVFLLYLLLTRSYSEYYYQSIYYNKKYYVRLADGSELNNPVRHIVIIFSDFIDRYKALLVSVKDLNLGNPLNTFMALGNTALIIYLVVTKRYKLSLFMFLVLVALTTRTDPLQSKETDYQSLPYNYFSLFNSVILIYFLSGYLKRQLELPIKLIFSSFYILLIILAFFSGFFLFNKSFEKFYAKFMGTQPLIYDRPTVASNLNKILRKDDYYYIGPFDFEENLYMKAKPASKYMITLPGMENSDKIKNETISDFKQNKPKVVVFNINDRIYGQETGKFLLGYLYSEYFTLDSLNTPVETININQNSLGDQAKYDLARHFFFDKNKKDEILETLIKEGWISKK